MKILHVSERDGFGGAHVAARRLHLQFVKSGITSNLLVQRARYSDSLTANPGWVAELRPRIDSIPARFARSADRPLFSVNWLPDTLQKFVGVLEPDIVHLHWINDGFLRIETLAQLPVPVVWTLHDCWPFTGGCHLPYSCDHFINGCGSCAKLRHPGPNDLSHRVWQRKKKSWQGWSPTIVAPSEWIANKALSSSLMKSWDVRVIRNGIDTAQFDLNHVVGDRARKKILLGAVDFADPNKGQGLLENLLTALRKRYKGEFEFNIFGTNAIALPAHWPVNSLGYVSETRAMAALYAESDAYLSLSRSENLPTSAIEALASGTACVAFNVGGTCEVITHGVNGHLAEDGDIEAMAEGLSQILVHPPAVEDCRDPVRQRFDIAATARQHLALYQEVLDRD